MAFGNSVSACHTSLQAHLLKIPNKCAQTFSNESKYLFHIFLSKVILPLCSRLFRINLLEKLYYNAWKVILIDVLFISKKNLDEGTQFQRKNLHMPRPLKMKAFFANIPFFLRFSPGDRSSPTHQHVLSHWNLDSVWSILSEPFSRHFQKKSDKYVVEFFCHPCPCGRELPFFVHSFIGRDAQALNRWSYLTDLLWNFNDFILVFLTNINALDGSMF